MRSPTLPSPQATGASAHLRTDHLSTTLRARSVRGVAISLAAQGSRSLINVAALGVLARMLTTEDFGLIFAVTAITSLIASFGDLGLPAATVQRTDITQAQVSTLFWINVATSGAVMVLTAALAPAIVWLYAGDHRLVPIVVAFGAIGLVGGLSVQHEALLRRQMRFTPLAVIDVGSLVGSRILAIAAAWYGAGYWALVAQSGAVTVLSSVGLWLACGWRPDRPARSTGLRPLLGFGGNLATGRLLSGVAANADKVVLQRFVGAAATGVYGNAWSLLSLPTTNLGEPFGSVAVPALSRLQDQPERFRSFYRNALLLLATGGMPIVAFVFVAADLVVEIILGPQWHEAARLFQILAPAAFIGTFNSATGWPYLALGHTDRQMRWVTFYSAVRIGASLVGARWGAVGVATAMSLTSCALRWPSITYCFRGTPLMPRDLGQALWRPALASVGAGIVVALGTLLGAVGGSAPLRLLVEVVIFVVAYVFIWLTLPGGRAALANVARLAVDLLPERAGKATGRS